MIGQTSHNWKYTLAEGTRPVRFWAILCNSTVLLFTRLINNFWTPPCRYSLSFITSRPQVLVWFRLLVQYLALLSGRYLFSQLFQRALTATIGGRSSSSFFCLIDYIFSFYTICIYFPLVLLLQCFFWCEVIHDNIRTILACTSWGAHLPTSKEAVVGIVCCFYRRPRKIFYGHERHCAHLFS